MLKKSKIIKTEKNDLKMLTNVENWNGKMPFSAYHEIKTKNYKNCPIYGDRFIPRRHLNRNNEINKKFYAEMPVVDILIWELSLRCWLQNSMAELLNNVFNIRNERILQFAATDDDNWKPEKAATTKSYDEEQKPTIAVKKDWICKARRKPFAYAESTHDSIGFSDCFERNMMDWSVNGQVVASFEDDVIIWRTIRDSSITFYVENTSCLAYGPNGKYLAIGCMIATLPVIELWDISKYGIKIKVTYRYFFKSKSLKINCFEWSKCGKFLIAGTNKGIIYVLSVPQMKIVLKIRPTNYSVTTMRFSTNMRYLASADAAGNILIFQWLNPKLTIYLHVLWKCKSKIMLDWHPWKGVYELAIAESKPASVVIFSVPSRKVISYNRRKGRNIEIDAIAFNKITAELCLSISKRGTDGFLESKILVLESLNRIVDELTIEYGARFLMWHPDGTHLVTAGNDDSLTIWKFYPDNYKKCSSNSDLLNRDTKQKLFYGCDRGEKFQLWSNVR